MAGDDIWAIEVVYDPQMWNFSTLLDALRPWMSAMAGYKQEPRAEAYWTGPDAQATASAASAALKGRPGIVSVEIGRARATSRPPGTGAAGTYPPATGR
jgi:hypothetical protein